MNYLLGFGLFFLIGGALAVWGGIEHWRRKRAQIRRAVAVTARVVEIESSGGVDPGDVTWYYPVVTFVVDGKSLRAKLLKGSSRRDEHKTGGTVRAYYDPLDPSQGVIRPSDFPGSGAATVLGVVFAVIGSGMIWAGWNGGR